MFRAYCLRLPYRRALEIWLCTLELMANIVFYGQDAQEGFKDIDVDWHLTFSFHYIM